MSIEETMHSPPCTLEELKTAALGCDIAIFGAGNVGRRVWGALKSIGISPSCFLDNYKSGIEEISGLPIRAPIDYIRGSANFLVLSSIMSKKNIQEAYMQLCEIGVSPERLLHFGEIVKMFDSTIFTWANSRESEYDFHNNDRHIEHLARWIDNEDESVADLGCGKSQHLRALLKPHCKYIPIDYVSRSADTLVCDFNNESFPQITVDVVFISGVLSQVRDVQRFLDWACSSAAKKVIIRDRTYEKEAMYAKFFGYLSTPSIEEIEQIAFAHNFVCDAKEAYFKGDTEFVLRCFVRKLA
jgi:hypothetical protein